MKPIAAGKIRRDLGKRILRSERAGGDGTEFPFRIAKVTSVDPLRRAMSVYCLTGNGDNYDSVPISAAGAGARHFLGAIPEVNDLCIVGFSPAESGHSRVPYVAGWLVPGVEAGYDWVTTGAARDDEVNLTPGLKEALKGSFGRRRHKTLILEEGNVAASSAQGSDLILNESARLENRRGHELVLRDQDGALVTRSLQRFHAGAGVRGYSGMVQRDASLLPTQMFSDVVQWDAARQIDAEGKALPSGDLAADTPNQVRPNPVFEQDFIWGDTNPYDVLKRGLFIDDDGYIYDDLVSPDAVYGGKPIRRVSIDGANGVLDSGAEVFSELRWEVAHTTDGTLPVTEQTDGVDVDRLLPSAPTDDPNPLNQSANRSMTTFVLGTAVGNDATHERESYGIPLVPQLYDKNGTLSPGLVPAGPDTPLTEHSAFLVSVRNPADPTAPAAFMAITKGGAFRSYFPGGGSKAQEEFYATGKRTVLGRDKDGYSQRFDAEGTLSLKSTGAGRNEDNVGIEVRAEGGAVSIYAGAASTAGASSYGAADLMTPAAEGWGLTLQSARGTVIEAAETLKLAGQTVRIEDADSVFVSGSASVSLVAGEVVSVTAKALAVTVNGKAEYTYGGPKNALPTNGPSRTTSFTATPITGGIGSVEDSYQMIFGQRKETFRVGRHTTDMNLGSYNIRSMGASGPALSPGSGIHLATGLPGLDNTLDLDIASATLKATVGTASLVATAGNAVVRGAVGVDVLSAGRVSLAASYVAVNVPTIFVGGVVSDGCLDSLTGRPLFLSGTLGVPTFRVGG